MYCKQTTYSQFHSKLNYLHSKILSHNYIILIILVRKLFCVTKSWSRYFSWLVFPFPVSVVPILLQTIGTCVWSWHYGDYFSLLDLNHVIPTQRLLIAFLGSVCVVWTSWPGFARPPLQAAVRGCWFASWCWRYSRAEDTPCTAAGASPVWPSSSPWLCASPHRHVAHSRRAGKNDSAPGSSTVQINTITDI